MCLGIRHVLFDSSIIVSVSVDINTTTKSHFFVFLWQDAFTRQSFQMIINLSFISLMHSNQRQKQHAHFFASYNVIPIMPMKPEIFENIHEILFFWHAGGSVDLKMFRNIGWSNSFLTHVIGNLYNQSESTLSSVSPLPSFFDRRLEIPPTSGPRRAGSFHGQASTKRGLHHPPSRFDCQISPNGISDSFWASLCNRSNSTASRWCVCSATRVWTSNRKSTSSI